MTSPALARLIALLESATPAPWREGSVEKYNVFAACTDVECLGTERVLLKMNTWFPHEVDAQLIAELRNAAPHLLALARAAQAWLDERAEAHVREQLDDADERLHDALRTALAELEATCHDKACPCKHTTPCHLRCTCVNPLSSSGCSRCCSYGSDEQRKAMARRIAERVDEHTHLQAELAKVTAELAVERHDNAEAQRNLEAQRDAATSQLATLRAALIEACDIAEAGWGCAYPELPGRVTRDIASLRTLADDKGGTE